MGPDSQEVVIGRLTAQVKNAERMMTHAQVTGGGIKLTFADGCKGVIPFSDIPEVGNPADLANLDLPNPYQIIIHGSKGEMVELPWDFVRHYCDASYQPRVEGLAISGMKSLGKRIRTIRETEGMTQTELAAAEGIGRITEVRIEKGTQSPRYETLAAIAQALRHPVTDLMVDETIY
jgi:DNA-binding XRE family transcriptional regulator